MRPHIDGMNLRVFLLVTLGECLAQIGVWTQVKRRLTLLVLDSQVGSVGSKETCDGRARLLISPRRSQPHEQLQSSTSFMQDMALIVFQHVLQYPAKNNIYNCFKITLRYKCNCFIVKSVRLGSGWHIRLLDRVLSSRPGPGMGVFVWVYLV